MLYVFYVDTGTMLTFDMSLAIESVNNLKQQIEKVYEVPLDKQVLLVSGGESLDPNARVCSYSAGTDTNPIYLFSKANIEATKPPLPNNGECTDIDFNSKVEDSIKMPSTYSTVVHRTQLAQLFQESAKEGIKVCSALVHEQHLQQQGWAAVIANFEDSVSEFMKRAELFRKGFDDYISERDSYIAFLQHFDKDLQTLTKIPIIPILLEKDIEQPTEKNSEEKVEEATESEQATQQKFTTLSDWISVIDNKNSVEQLFKQCSYLLTEIDSNVFNNVNDGVKNVSVKAYEDHMKDIKGLSDRLCGLEQLMFEANRYFQEQCDLAKSFLQNQNRASNIGDPSILPDLCISHSKQLTVMLNNQKQLSDIRRRCLNAKTELSGNLHCRLKWIMYMESVMLDLDQKMVAYHETVKRLRRHLEILQQIHLAPATYLSAVAEVVRRRAFSQAFLSWASELACYLLTIHNDEITRRKDFQVQFDSHFLTALFPGMDDVPPAFATEAPSIFDSNLPKLTPEDIEYLKTELPELTQDINIPDIAAINNLFMMKSFVKTDIGKTDDRGVEEKIVQVVNEVGLASNLDQNLLKPAENEICLTAHGIPLLKDLDRGCESETDTEEFEKVGQSPLELHFDKEISSPRPRTHDASTLTEDNLQTSRSEHDRLKSLLLKMSVLARQTIGQLRVELNDLRSCVELERSNMELHYESLTSSWENLTVEMDNKEREVIQRITYDHELELNDYKKLNQSKELEVKVLHDEITRLECALKNSEEIIGELKITLNKLQDDHGKEKQSFEKDLHELKKVKEQSLKEINEKLTREHKAEIENIRSRFRLMTVASMERSPSEQNLEGIERTETKECVNHEAIILQVKENCEIEKEKAVNLAVLQESRKWESILNEKLIELKTKFELEKELLLDEVNKKVSEEKDKQINALRERETVLNMECTKYKNTIQQFTENRIESQNSELQEKVEALQKDKNSLETQLQILEKSKRGDEGIPDMGASVAVYEGKANAATSPIKHSEKLSKSQTNLAKQSSKLSIDSCHCGDIVLVLWDPTYKNYRIIQEGSHLYFLHSDCLETLGLNIKANEEREMYFTGEVVEKDYCHAKKVGNRYNVPRGTKFFRVKVKALPSSKESKPDIKDVGKEKSQMSQSETAGPSLVTDVPPSDATGSWSLPVTPLKQSPVEAEGTQKTEMEASKESNR